ncbi:MAG: hypothetical protein EXR50_05555 [Dehalococcoidia bacterium]|nr:hypothetical protein [Dehalococcoidia bacterium]
MNHEHRLDSFWKEYQSYKDAESKDRRSVPLLGGAAEIYYAMGTVRCNYKGVGEIELQGSEFQKSLQEIVQKHRLTSDFRDESYVISDEGGTYLGRIRGYELLFTPAAFEGQESILEDMIWLFSYHLK